MERNGRKNGDNIFSNDGCEGSMPKKKKSKQRTGFWHINFETWKINPLENEELNDNVLIRSNMVSRDCNSRHFSQIEHPEALD